MIGRGDVGDGPIHTPCCERCGHEWYLHRPVSPLLDPKIIYRCFWTWEDKGRSTFHSCDCTGTYGPILRLEELRERVRQGWLPEHHSWIDASEESKRPSGET